MTKLNKTETKIMKHMKEHISGYHVEGIKWKGGSQNMREVNACLSLAKKGLVRIVKDDTFHLSEYLSPGNFRPHTNRVVNVVPVMDNEELIYLARSTSQEKCKSSLKCRAIFNIAMGNKSLDAALLIASYMIRAFDSRLDLKEIEQEITN